MLLLITAQNCFHQIRARTQLRGALHYAPNEIIAPGHISDFELGKREPNLIVLLAYSRLSNIPLNNIVDDELLLPEKLPSKPKLKKY